MRRVVLGLVLVVSACSSSAAGEFEGVWQSVGFGSYLLVDGGSADLYEYATTHCLLVNEGESRGIERIATLDDGDLVLEDAGRIVRFEPIAALPQRCEGPGDPSPATAFAAAVATIRDHFHPGVDDEFDARATIPAPEDDAALADALENLLAPLGDPQVAFLPAVGDAWSAGVGPVPDALAEALLAGRLVSGVEVAGNDGIVLAELAPGVRYLAFLRLTGFAADRNSSEQVLLAALDRSLRLGESLVLDLRAASVGAEAEALLVATRFVSERTVVATRSARTPEGDLVAAGEEVTNPLQTGPFTGRVIVLTGPGTVGAAELLVLALRDLATVTVVGEGTAGSPGPVLVRTLPNGWLLAVPNIEITTPDGTTWAGRPIAPDVEMPLTVEDVAAGTDPGLVEALRLLGASG